MPSQCHAPNGELKEKARPDGIGSVAGGRWGRRGFAEGAGVRGRPAAVHEVDEHAAVGELERGFDGVGQALVNTMMVDDHLDGVLVLLASGGSESCTVSLSTRARE